MPEIHPPRRKAFANLLAQGLNPEQAYLQARYPGEAKHAKDKGRRLADQPEVRARMVELRDQLHRHNVTVDSLTFEYEEARQLALNVENPGAAVSATTGKAKLHGLDKSEQINIDNRTVQVMGDVELARRMTMLLERGVNALDEMPAVMPVEQREHLNAHLHDPDVI